MKNRPSALKLHVKSLGITNSDEEVHNASRHRSCCNSCLEPLDIISFSPLI